MTPGHLLTSCDAALQAFYRSKNITGLPNANIVRNKESVATLPLMLTCAFVRAERKNGRQWEVFGSIELASDPVDDAGDITVARLDATTEMEKAVLNSLEDSVPASGQAQPLAEAIMAAANAANAIEPTEFLITSIAVKSVASGFDDDAVWTFSVDVMAKVVA